MDLCLNMLLTDFTERHLVYFCSVVVFSCVWSTICIVCRPLFFSATLPDLSFDSMSHVVVIFFFNLTLYWSTVDLSVFFFLILIWLLGLSCITRDFLLQCAGFCVVAHRLSLVAPWRAGS